MPISEEDLKIMNNIKGYFDVHITVSNRNIYKFIQYCHFNNFKPVYAIGMTGKNKHQLMLSKYINDNFATILKFANELRDDIMKNNIEVLRVKIESLANNIGINEFLQTKEYKHNLRYYFEFHFKIDVRSREEQEKLDEICEKYQASYAVNILGKTPHTPLITFRIRAESFNEAYEERMKLYNLFKNGGFNLPLDGIHSEFTIYDTNLELDEGLVPCAIEKLRFENKWKKNNEKNNEKK